VSLQSRSFVMRVGHTTSSANAVPSQRGAASRRTSRFDADRLLRNEKRKALIRRVCHRISL
jgi:hypothetical protein